MADHPLLLILGIPFVALIVPLFAYPILFLLRSIAGQLGVSSDE
jgi:hypothetical protein